MDKLEQKFNKTAKEIAAYISKWENGGTATIPIDGIWVSKQLLSLHLFRDFGKNFHAFEWDGKFADNLKIFDQFKNPDLAGLGKIPPLLSPDPKHWVYDSKTLKALFGIFLEVYSPPMKDGSFNLPGVWTHLWAMQLYYSEIGYHIKNANTEALFRLDFAFTQLAVCAQHLITTLKIKGPRDFDRTIESTLSKSKKQEAWQKKAIEIYTARPGLHRENKHYTIAFKILEQWPKKGLPKPSQRSLAIFFKEYLSRNM